MVLPGLPNRTVSLLAMRDGTFENQSLRRVLLSHRKAPRQIVSYKLRSYPIGNRGVMLEVVNVSKYCANNRVEQSH